MNGIFGGLPWWGLVLVALGLTHITIASVTIFLHRHQAHRALDLHPLPSHFFRFWLWLTTGMVTKEWAAIHRKHHAKCETTEDPHSPQVLGIHRVLWGGLFLYKAECRNAETMARFGHGTPDDWLERNIYAPYNWAGILAMLVIDVILFGWAGMAIWGVQMVWIPFWAAGVINGLGHFWGYRNFDCADASTNLVPWGILIGGEELHNNHHSFATSAKLSARWYEFDIGWFYIRCLEVVGLASVRKVIPKPRFVEARSVPDAAMLQAIITHRYDVMRRYTASLRNVLREEAARLRGRGVEPKAMLRFIARGDGAVSVGQRAACEDAVRTIPRLALLVRLRDELAALWARSSATTDQLIGDLQSWLQRAEQSGIDQLMEFSRRLRSYAT
ncbi:MAG: fatty acid desaturase [Rhodocyclaceae bacterium]|nr:fatty acid desaturase [Rhodocyclaceae bacterium]